MAKPYQYKTIPDPISTETTPVSALHSHKIFYRLEKLGQWEYSIIQLKDGVERTIGVANLLSIVQGKLNELMLKDSA